MGPKLLFVFGIVAAHGAVGAAWCRQDSPQQRTAMATCVNAPAPLPYIESRGEMLAHVVDLPNEDPMQP
jgi:hypothetical protein